MRVQPVAIDDVALRREMKSREIPQGLRRGIPLDHLMIFAHREALLNRL